MREYQEYNDNRHTESAREGTNRKDTVEIKRGREQKSDSAREKNRRETTGDRVTVGKEVEV